MKGSEHRKYDMLVRIGHFGTTHREAFPEDSVGGRAFATIAAAVTQLAEATRSKVTTSRESRSTKGLARVALVDRLRVIARTARIIADSHPGFDDPFTLARRRQSDQTLLVNGQLFVRDAEAVKAQFIAHGLPPAFVSDLQACVTQFQQAIEGREVGRSGQAAAQASIEAAFASAFAALRKLDVIVINQLRADAVAMAVWKRERRVEPAKVRHTGQATRPAPTTSDTPVNSSLV